MRRETAFSRLLTEVFPVFLGRWLFGLKTPFWLWYWRGWKLAALRGNHDRFGG